MINDNDTFNKVLDKPNNIVLIDVLNQVTSNIIDRIIESNNKFFEGIFEPANFLKDKNDDGSKCLEPITNKSIFSFFDQIVPYCEEINNLFFKVLDCDFNEMNKNWESIIVNKNVDSIESKFYCMCGVNLSSSVEKALDSFIFNKTEHFINTSYTIDDMADITKVLSDYMYGMIALNDSVDRKNFEDFNKSYFIFINDYRGDKNISFKASEYLEFKDMFNGIWKLPNYNDVINDLVNTYISSNDINDYGKLCDYYNDKYASDISKYIPYNTNKAIHI